MDCLRDMFRVIELNNWGMPMEVEVENHLVNKFFDDLAMMFPFVRICNPGNSQEKHAEHLNRAKKYGPEKRMHGAGRWWARSEAYQSDVAKVNDEYKDVRLSYEQLVADDIAACNQFNQELHPKQDKYPGMTRWQVLEAMLNPNLGSVSKSVVYRCIGYRTETSLRRNQYVQVQHAYYSLPNPGMLTRLQPGNYSLTAYYLPTADNRIEDVYLFQGDRFICKADKISTYNTAKAEQTEADVQSYQQQAEYVGRFDGMVKSGRKGLIKPEIITETFEIEDVELVPTIENRDNTMELPEEDWVARAKKSL